VEAVGLNVEKGRATITISRPDVHNAMNWDVFDGLAKAFEEIHGQPDVRVVLVRGEGGSFSSGIDLNLFSEVAGDPIESIARAQAPFRKLAALTVPTVAAIRGHAYGAGLQLALCCDVRLATTDARLGLLEVRYGLVPDLGATAVLPRLVGPARAKWMMWSGEKIDGDAAAASGLIELVVAPEGFDEECDRIASLLASGPPIVLAEIKRLVDRSHDLSFEGSMDEVATAQRGVLASKDFAEAIAAFVERRDPDYSGS
jgi:2-(1,2-epoxy-1,2-dihydrophenyl)acetyl-CoA isomerase